jgi:alkylation response protein AidB-like acyl-CoA dehydrogenase
MLSGLNRTRSRLMTFSPTMEQEMLRESVRGFLDAKLPIGRVREIMETETGFDEGFWHEAAQQGFQAMAIPEEYGGAGFSLFELGIVMEELGRALTPAPFLSSIVLGATAVLTAGSEQQRTELLSSIAAGERRVALAVGEAGSPEIRLAVVAEGGDVVLTGTKSYVVDGHTADTLLVAGRGDDGVSLYIVPADSPGVSATRLETLDMTRKQATVEFDGVRIPQTARLGAAGSGAATLETVMNVAVTMLAFEQVGGAARCLEMSVEYAKERVQFGRAIGSFQAIKHKCADMLVELENARSAAYYAGWAADHDPGDFPVAAALAKASCSDAYFHAAAETIQIHGGIGFTWEHDAHLYFKRAKTDALLFGDAVQWRSTLADRVGL